MATTVSFEKAVNKIRKIGEIVRRPLRDTLDGMGGVIAIQMARTAQPFGTGEEARLKGEGRVATDILRVYATISGARKDISDPRYQGAFWAKFKDGDIEGAQRLLNKFGDRLRGVPIGAFDGGYLHRARRNRTTGRIPESQRPLLVVTNWKALERYVKEEKTHVGEGKGGFADIVRAIGGTPRGLREKGDITANWITRKSVGHGKAFHGGTDEHPTLIITNTVPYASEILNGTALSEAKFIGRERAIAGLLGVKATLLAEVRAAT